jgi:hypothetical protein
MLSAMARPAAPVLNRFEERKPRSGGMQEKAPEAATIRDP